MVKYYLLIYTTGIKYTNELVIGKGSRDGREVNDPEPWAEPSYMFVFDAIDLIGDDSIPAEMDTETDDINGIADDSLEISVVM